MSPAAKHTATVRTHFESQDLSGSQVTINPRRNGYALICAIAVFGLTFVPDFAAGQDVSESRLRSNSSTIDRLVQANETGAPQPRYDAQVVPIAFERSPQRLNTQETWSAEDLARIQAGSQDVPASNAPRLNFVQREQSEDGSLASGDTGPKKETIGPMVANIGMNLAIVLFIGTGVVVLAKQWINPQSKTNALPSSSALQVKEVLALDDKSTLRVIQWQNTHILVASDAQGVRSVVPLTPTFSDTMHRVEADLAASSNHRERTHSQPTPSTATPVSSVAARVTNDLKESPGAIDDRLIQMLLDTANRSTPRKSYAAEGGA